MDSLVIRLAVSLLVAALLVALAGLGVRAFVRASLYPAPRVPVPAPPPPLEEVFLDTSTGERVQAWSFAGAEAGETPPAPVLLLFHGNGENLGTLAHGELLVRFRRLGAPFLASDYPGYGRSSGTPGEAELVAAAEAALDRARARHPERPVVAIGWSLGAAVAAQLAARRPDDLEGLVLLSPWSRLEDVAAIHYPDAVARALLGGRYDTLAAVGELPMPVWVIHGASDRIIPVEQGEAVFRALPAARRRWLPVAGAGHNDLWGREEVWQTVRTALRHGAAEGASRGERSSPGRGEGAGEPENG